MDIDSAWSEIRQVPFQNEQLTKDILDVAQQTGDITETAKTLLTRIYDALIQLSEVLSGDFNSGLFTPTDRVIFEAWRSFLQPIQALRQLPSCGEFVAARLLLFTGRVFVEEPGVSMPFKRDTLVQDTRPLYEFIADMDDALLAPLKKMWTLSQSRERFDWVFTDFDIDPVRALALSPQELKDNDGIEGMRYYYDDGSDSEEYTLYTGPIPRWDCGEQDWDDFEWALEGSNGSITAYLEYDIRQDEAGGVTSHGIDVFRRSRQFCRDARQKSEAHIGRQQHQAFDEAARGHNLPPEMRNRILSYVEYRDPFPYLEKLDLAEAYAPFPKVGGHCDSCDDTEGESTATRTCPQKAVHVWNLALRRFHTFHKNSCHKWSLCTRHDCTGHHNDQEDWEATREPGFTRYLESQAARGNDEFESLDQVGLGPMHPIRQKVEADTARDHALFRGNGIYDESSEDARMIGGLGGLKDAMIHGRTLIDVWEGDGGFSIYNDGAIG